MQLRNKKFYTINLGCRSNAYEINCIATELINNQAKKVKDLSKADICIINTCSVTNKADTKSKYFINKVLRVNKTILLVVMGCFSQTNPDYFKQYKKIIAIGNKYKNKVVDLIKMYKNKPIIKIESCSKLNKFEQFENISFIDNTRVFLKIQDGCNFMCSYCIIPFSRGRQRSLDHKKIVNEIKILSKKYKEIVLTGINTAGYLDESGCDFYSLLKKINTLSGDFRIRISSIEPFQITKQIIDLISNNPRFVQQFHLCLQSGSDKILKLMNRKYTIKKFNDLVKYMRSKNKFVSVTTDYIVGFNNETDQDFKDSLESLKLIKFADMHIFPFSMRKFTAIANDKNVVNSSTKNKRFKQVYELNKKLKNEYLTQFVGQEVEVIFEKPKQKNIQEGHSNYFFKVFVKTCKQLHGQKFRIKITKIINDQLFGELIN